MGKKKFSDEQLIEAIGQGMTNRQFAELEGLNERSVERRRAKLKKKGVDFSKPLASGTMLEPHERRERLKGKRFVITSAQNNTHIVKPFLSSLEQYCKINDAQLLVSTFTYNKNGFQKLSKDSDEVWYDKSIVKYMHNDASIICDDLLLCGELNILPTAVNPLSGLHNYTNTASGIIPHAKMRVQSLATARGEHSRILYTTGACTQRNYIQQKAGQKAEHHHSLSALVVEVDDGGDWFVRQLCYDKRLEGFYDLNAFYSPSGIKHCYPVEGITFGDIHAAKLDDTVAEVSWRSDDSIMDTLKPEHVFLHDVHDQQARNHHNVKDPHFLFSMHVNGTESVVDEVKLSASVISEFKRQWCNVVVVESNHDLALERWLKEQDYRKDPVNAIFFLEMQLAKYKSIVQRDDTFSIFEHACKLNGLDCDGVQFLRQDEPYTVAGVGCGNHGHLGNNGGRGSVKAYADRGVKVTIGHGHGFCVYDGAWMSGVSGLLYMGYNIGGSNWNHTHVLQYENGKRCGITIKNGKWRG